MIGNAFGCIYLWSSEIYPTIVRLVDPWNSTFLTNEKRVALRLIKTNWSKMNASYVIQLMLYLDESGNYAEDSDYFNSHVAQKNVYRLVGEKTLKNIIFYNQEGQRYCTGVMNPRCIIYWKVFQAAYNLLVVVIHAHLK